MIWDTHYASIMSQAPFLLYSDCYPDNSVKLGFMISTPQMTAAGENLNKILNMKKRHSERVKLSLFMFTRDDDILEDTGLSLW